MKSWDMIHRGILLGMGSLTVIATYRSWHEYQKRIVLNEEKELKRRKAREAQRAAARKAFEDQVDARKRKKRQLSGGGETV
jgi:hypothetical protein